MALPLMGTNNVDFIITELGFEDGYTDHMFEIFAKHNHPFILVGSCAHRWMGARGCFDEYFDIVLRNDKLEAITADLVRTQKWELLNHQKLTQGLTEDELDGYVSVHRIEIDANYVLGRTNQQALSFQGVRIWSEERYCLNLDSTTLVEVPDIHPWNPFLIEEDYHPTRGRTDGWWYGPNTLSNPNDIQLFFPNKGRGKSENCTSPIFIPSVADFMNALAFQRIRPDTKEHWPRLYHFSDWMINNLIRYLYLELPHQKQLILFLAEEKTEAFLQKMIESFKRKPHMVFDDQRNLHYVNIWDPKTYPASYLSELKIDTEDNLFDHS